MAEVNGSPHIKLLAKHKNKSNQWRRAVWPKGLGDYLKFVVLKENLDTINAVQCLSKFMYANPSSFQVAGTKDKRAVTAQWCTIYRRRPEEIVRMNLYRHAPLVKVGNFEYTTDCLHLGDLAGNKFEIVLRDVTATEDVVESACDALKKSGFINYYGLQRFGSGAARSHTVGLQLLLKDWKQAVALMFSPTLKDNDTVRRVKELFAKGEFSEAAPLLPVSMSNERKIISHLSSKKQDYQGAFYHIPRSVKLLYVHAYQSYIWNLAASARIEEFGLTCVEGDLVVTNPNYLPEEIDTLGDAAGETVDQMHAVDTGAVAGGEEGEVDLNATDAVLPERGLDEAVHVVTANDVAIGRFSIVDVVLPIVGWRVRLPGHTVGDKILTWLRRDGILSLGQFFTGVPKEYRLAGNYRRLLQRPSDFTWRHLRYSDPHAELLETELHREELYRLPEGVAGKKGGRGKKRDAAEAVEEQSSGTDASRAHTQLSGGGPLLALNPVVGSSSEMLEGLDVFTKGQGPVPTSDQDETGVRGDHLHAMQERMTGEDEGEGKGNHNHIRGLHLVFSLPPGTYATMLLRELTKESTDARVHRQLTRTSAAAHGAPVPSTGEEKVLVCAENLTGEL